MRGGKTTVRFLVPDVNLGILGKHEVYGAWFLTNLLRQRTRRKLDVDEWVPLKSTILKKRMPFRSYKKIINHLVEQHIVECDDSYTVGVSSKKYRLGSDYRTVDYRAVEYRVGARTARKVSGNRCNQVDDSPYLSTLKSYLSRLSVRPESESVLAEFPTAIRATLELPLFDLRCPDAVVDSFGNRLHTPLTRMKRELRQCLNFDGNALVEIDIANSQPIMLCLLKLREQKDNQVIVPNVNSSLCSFQNKIQPASAPHNHSLHYVVTFQSSDALKETTEAETRGLSIEADWQEFITLCFGGDLYSAVGKMTKASRQRAKKRMMRLLFQQPGRQWKFKSMLQGRFPNVVHFLDDLKATDHRHAAW